MEFRGDFETEHPNSLLIVSTMNAVRGPWYSAINKPTIDFRIGYEVDHELFNSRLWFDTIHADQRKWAEKVFRWFRKKIVRLEPPKRGLPRYALPDALTWRQKPGNKFLGWD